MKQMLDNLVKKYETKDFIKDDPVQFAHRFKDKKDIEIASFIAALFAFGKRAAFIQKLNMLFSIMQNEPHNFICDFRGNEKVLSGFVYRFVNDNDLMCFLSGLNRLYVIDKSSLGELFYEGKKRKEMLSWASHYFYGCLCHAPNPGFCHLFARPEKGGAMKRMNMYLRWMVRCGPVDVGLWDFIKPAELMIPLDVHVGKVSRSLGLLQRRANDFKAVVELTEKLKELDPDDPIKYDFALFGAGVSFDTVRQN